MNHVFAYLLALIIGVMLPIGAYPYADGTDQDVVIDAPWITTRNYVPILIFLPEVNSFGSELATFAINNYDPTTNTILSRVFFDDRATSTVPTCVDVTSRQEIQVPILSADGEIRGDLIKSEAIEDFWHYIVRLPVACLERVDGSAGQGEFYLFASVGQRVPNLPNWKPDLDTTRALRVIVRPNGPAKFHSLDHHYDIHFHSIAEQTSWEVGTNVDAARKAFGGPLAMVIESAYAIGIIETQLRQGNWAGFRNQIALTDHNVFFSDPPYDSGTTPRYGPTRFMNSTQEFEWARRNFGRIAGEEITLHGLGRKNSVGNAGWLHGQWVGNVEIDEWWGTHFLSYGAPHFEGPWHGGGFTGAGFFTGTNNQNQIWHVLDVIGDSDGFGYLAHPFSSRDGAPNDWFPAMLGYNANLAGASTNTNLNAILLNRDESNFVYKGMQIWNGKSDLVPFRNSADCFAPGIICGSGLPNGTEHRINPYLQSDFQSFVYNNRWDRSLLEGLSHYKQLVYGGLNYHLSLSNGVAPIPVNTIRKHYISAGTDAHGDFNSQISIGSTVEAEINDNFLGALITDGAQVKSTSSAFGRVRTYALSSERLIEPGYNIRSPLPRPPLSTIAQGELATKAFQSGNTVLTDGPLCKISVDSNCHLDSDNLEWHDDTCLGENADGLIGGKGPFDGGNTALVPSSGTVTLHAKFIGGNEYYSSANSRIPLEATLTEIGTRVSPFVPIQQTVIDVPLGSLSYGALSSFDLSYESLRNPVAWMLTGKHGSHEQRNLSYCITNPVWGAPYSIAVHNKSGRCPIAVGDLIVSASFEIAVDERMNAVLKPIDSDGRSTNLAYSLIMVDQQPSSAVTKATAFTNDTVIPCGTSNWNSDLQMLNDQTTPISSYAMIFSDITDHWGNPLNAIGMAFTAIRDVADPSDDGGGLTKANRIAASIYTP